MALIGFDNIKPATAPAAAPDDLVYDVSTRDFEAKILKASMTRPVLVDFWAPWCGPCKQLTPVLEDAVRAAKGGVVLAKVNIDENPDLAQAFRIQSVPTVLAIFQGQPVTGFAGAQGPAEIARLIKELVTLAQRAGVAAGGVDITQILAQADAALASGDFAAAQQFYAQALAEDGTNGPAYAGMIRATLAGGDTVGAQEMADAADEDMQKNPQVVAALSALALAQNAPQNANIAQMMDKIAHNPDDHAARIELALALFADGARDAAVDALIESIRRDRDWNEGQAKKQLFTFFDAMGAAEPVTVAGRRKLSALLFS